jgi:hypothetical protein
MLGTNKNQSIHEILTSIFDHHKPYGGLSMIFTGDLKQLGMKDYETFLIHSHSEPVKDGFIFKPSSIHGRSRTAENLWSSFENFHLTEKVRSAGDPYFSGLCDRIGFDTLTQNDIDCLKSRDIPCPLENDPANFKQGKVCIT